MLFLAYPSRIQARASQLAPIYLHAHAFAFSFLVCIYSCQQRVSTLVCLFVTHDLALRLQPSHDKLLVTDFV